jgi:hypothetical protein
MILSEHGTQLDTNLTAELLQKKKAEKNCSLGNEKTLSFPALATQHYAAHRGLLQVRVSNRCALDGQGRSECDFFWLMFSYPSNRQW